MGFGSPVKGKGDRSRSHSSMTSVNPSTRSSTSRVQLEERRDLNILALDTSTSYSALAIQRADAAVFYATPDPSQKHGRSLLPAVRDLLAEAGLSVSDLDALAVGLGPGSYTGLRIGLTAAKTLAFAKGKRLVG